jgi:hypothetical protein
VMRAVCRFRWLRRGGIWVAVVCAARLAVAGEPAATSPAAALPFVASRRIPVLRVADGTSAPTAPSAPPVQPPSPGLERPRSSRLPGWLGGALIGAGVVAAAAGVLGVVIDGKGTCDTRPPDLCPLSYTTELAGTLLIGAGTAATIAGGMVLYRNGSSAVSVALTPRLALATARF